MYNGIVSVRQIIKQVFLMKFLSILLILITFPVSVQAQQVVECRAKTTPQINVIPKTENVKYDFTKSKAQLNSVDVDTISPYGPNHKTYVSGLMSGAIQIKS